MRIQTISLKNSNLIYRWKKDGVPYTTTNSDTLTIKTLTENDAGSYQVFIFEDGGYGSISQVVNISIGPKIGDNNACFKINGTEIKFQCDGANLTINNINSVNLEYLKIPSYNPKKNGYYIKNNEGVYYFQINQSSPTIIAKIDPLFFYVGGDKNSGFGVDGQSGTVYFGSIPLKEIDLSSFKILNEHYQKDKGSAYYDSAPIEHDDLDHFSILAADYSKLPSLATYPDLTDYAYGNNKLFYQGTPIAATPIGSMAIVKENVVRAGANLYKEGLLFGEAGSFVVLNNFYMKDSKQAYFNGAIFAASDLAGLDVFDKVNNHYFDLDQYAFDSAHLYFQGILIAEAPKNTIKPIASDYLVANNKVYCLGAPVYNSDFSSFHFNEGDQTIADKNRIYPFYAIASTTGIGCVPGTLKKPLTLTSDLNDGGLKVTGDPLSLSVKTDTSDLTYVWRKNDIVLPLETTNSLNFKSLTESDSGIYSVTVSDTLGTIKESIHLPIEVKSFPNWPKPCFNLGGTSTNVIVYFTCGLNTLPKLQTSFTKNMQVLDSCGSETQNCWEFKTGKNIKIFYVKDAGKTYQLILSYPTSNTQTLTIDPLTSDPISLSLSKDAKLNTIIAKDLNSNPKRIWFNSAPILDITDPTSFIQVSPIAPEGSTYQKDNQNVYFNGVPIANAETSSFQFKCLSRSSLFATDSTRLYRDNIVIENKISPESVNCIGEIYPLVKTPTNVYCGSGPWITDSGAPNPVDVATFQIVDSSGRPYSYGSNAIDKYSNYNLYSCKQTPR